MLNVSRTQISPFICLAAVLLLFGCSQESPSSRGGKSAVKKADAAETLSADEQQQKPAEEEKKEGADPVDAFAATLHPVMKENCGTCHGAAVSPLFAGDDPVAAFKVVSSGTVVDLENPKNSRLYLRVAEDQHNCWGDCEENGEVIAEKLAEWKAMLASDEEEGGNKTDHIYSLENSIPDFEEVVIPDGVYVIEAETGTLTENGIQLVSEDGASGGSFIEGQGNNNSRADYSVSVAEAGTYYAFYRMRAAANNANSFNVRLAGANQNTLLTTDQLDDAWHWVQLSANDEPLGFELEAGENAFEVRRRENGTKLDTIVITNNPNMQPDSVTGAKPKGKMEFDLSEVLGVSSATLTVDIGDFDGENYLISAPTLNSSDALVVKDMEILVNGNFRPQHSTFKHIDMEVPAGEDTRLSPATAIVLRDKGIEEDQISFRFSVLQKK